MVGDLDRFLLQGGGVDGVQRGIDVLQVKVLASSYCAIRRNEGISSRARARDKTEEMDASSQVAPESTKRAGRHARARDKTEEMDVSSQVVPESTKRAGRRAASDKEFPLIGSVSGGGEKGDEGGDLGAFIGGVTRGRGLGFWAPRQDRTVEERPVLEQGSCLRRKTTDRWAAPVSVWRRGARHRFGKCWYGPWADFLAGPNGRPAASLYFFSYFSFFYFLVCFKTFSK
jgi:hypothetical protein